MIAYINTDGTGVGYLSMGGSHSLENFVNEIIREVKDPVHEATLESRIRSRLRVREYNSSDYQDQKESDRYDFRLYPM